MSNENEGRIRLPAVYIGLEELPITLANYFVIQHEHDEFVLTLCQYISPILLGTVEERREQAAKLSYVPVKVVSRVAFTRERLTQLIEILQEHLRGYDADKERGKEE